MSYPTQDVPEKKKHSSMTKPTTNAKKRQPLTQHPNMKKDKTINYDNQKQY